VPLLKTYNIAGSGKNKVYARCQLLFRKEDLRRLKASVACVCTLLYKIQFVFGRTSPP